MAKVYIIDGNSLLFRAYYATAYRQNEALMRTKDGIPTNALFAFGNMINKILNSLKDGEHIFVAFDTGKATFRKEEFEDYKAQRKPVDEQLIIQMPLARQLLTSLGIYVYEEDGYEADDLCGTLAKIASKEKHQVVIYTSDRDFLQLIDKNISVHLLKTGLSNIEIVNYLNMVEGYGVRPDQVPDFKGLTGDSSDNLPGIPGVGPKTAINLLSQFETLEEIIEAAPSMTSKVGENIVTHAEVGLLTKKLATIHTSVDLPFSLDATLYQGYDFKVINDFAQTYELKSLLNRLPQKFRQSSLEPNEIKYLEVTSFKNITLKKEIGLALDVEEGNYFKSEIFGLAICDDQQIYYIKNEYLQNDETLKKILEDKTCLKHVYDAKAIKILLSRLSINLEGLAFDLLLSAYLLDTSLKNEAGAIYNYFGKDIYAEDDNLISLFENAHPLRTSKIAYFALKLKENVQKLLKKEGVDELYHTIELPLAIVLAEMEIEGFPLQVDVLKAIGETFSKQINILSEQIFILAGEIINLNSPKQVGELLYDKLLLPRPKKDSTSFEVLSKLSDEYEIVRLILEYRKYAKLQSTYIEGISAHLYEDGKLHTIFNQALTTTGRLSSSEPNLQNISVRDEEGRLIRQAFYYNDENVYIGSFDYSQIELRVLAVLSNCQTLIKAFNEGEDIHDLTAKALFSEDDLDARRKAKAVNFGIVYGISDWGLSEQLNISVKEAKKIIETFFLTYQEVDLFLKSMVEEAFQNGYVSTYFKRRRYIREIYETNYHKREFAKRAAMNAPIQGTAADLIKLAMINVTKMLKEKGYKSRLVLQIHDELIFKIPRDEKELVKKDIIKVMENISAFKMKLKVEGNIAKSWYDV